MRARALSSAQPVGLLLDSANANAAAAFLDDLASQPESLRSQGPEARQADAAGMPAPASETNEVCIKNPVYAERGWCIQNCYPALYLWPDRNRAHTAFKQLCCR